MGAIFLQNKPIEADAELVWKEAKLLLQKMWPHFTAKLMEVDDFNKILLGFVHLIDTDPAEGLVWRDVSNGKKNAITTLKREEIASIKLQSLFKVSGLLNFLYMSSNNP